MMFAKLKDWARDSDWKRTREQIKKRDAFFANIYTIAWSYYQQVEDQAIMDCCEFYSRINKEAVSKGIIDYSNTIRIIPAYSLEGEAKKIYGEIISVACVRKAMNDLLQEDVDWFIRNPNWEAARQFGKEYIQVPKSMAVLTDNEIFALIRPSCSSEEIPELGAFYSFSVAMNATCPKSIQCIPEKTDERVYLCNTGTIDYKGNITIKKEKRTGAPCNYLYEVLQEEALQSTPKQAYQFHDDDKKAPE